MSLGAPRLRYPKRARSQELMRPAATVDLRECVVPTYGKEVMP